MPVVPFTHNHRRHTIAHHDDCSHDCDLDHVTADDIRTFDDEQHDDDQSVTVADLLDLRAVVIDDDGNHWNDASSKPHWVAFYEAKRRADHAVIAAYRNVRSALESHQRHREFIADLSPEERAEFDRRTT